MRFLSVLALLATTSSRATAHQKRVERYDPDLGRLLDCRYPEILHECLESGDRHAGQQTDNACHVAASCAPLKRSEETSDGKLWEDEQSGESSHQRRRRQKTESQEPTSQEPATNDGTSPSSSDPAGTTEETVSSSEELESTTIQESTAASASTEGTQLSSAHPSSQPSSTLPSSTSSTEAETTTEVGASCFSRTVKSTTICPVESSGGHESTLECYSTNITKSTCSPGLLCTTGGTYGHTICMEMQNEIGLAGKIIAACFGAAIAVCVGTLGVLIYQDKRKQQELTELREAKMRWKERS